MNLSELPMMLKLLIEILFSCLYIFLFNKIYNHFVENIYHTMKEESASDYYSLLNMGNYIVLFFIGTIFILLNTNTKHYLFVFIEFFLFSIIVYYGKSSLKLMDHFIFLLFRPNHLSQKEYLSPLGSIEYFETVDKSKKEYMFTHIFSNLNFKFIA